MKLDNIVIIAAGGIGKRLANHLGGKKKQFVKIGNKTILEHVIDKFYEHIDIKEFIVVVPHVETGQWPVSGDSRSLLTNIKNKYPNIKFVQGGAQRQDSINNGLKEVESDNGIVLVHDAVRPFFEKDEILNLIEQANKYGAACLGVKAKDTIKLQDDSIFIDKTIDRTKVWLIHTPQAFELKLLKKAYEAAYKNNFKGTDDSSLVEYIGHKVKLVEDTYANIKITDKTDFKLANKKLNP